MKPPKETTPTNIAVIGWGSLIWCPGSLQIRTRWRSGGPDLPIEFARISQDGRLTLVIHLSAPAQPTFWAVSSCDDFKCAKKNLGEREGNVAAVRGVTKAEYDGNAGEGIPTIVHKWLQLHDEIDGAIWTGLKSNWKEKRDNKDFSKEEAVTHLESLIDQKGLSDEHAALAKRAEEYIRNTPELIITPARESIIERLGWTANPLPDILFEDSSHDIRSR